MQHGLFFSFSLQHRHRPPCSVCAPAPHAPATLTASFLFLNPTQALLASHLHPMHLLLLLTPCRHRPPCSGHSPAPHASHAPATWTFSFLFLTPTQAWLAWHLHLMHLLLVLTPRRHRPPCSGRAPAPHAPAARQQPAAGGRHTEGGGGGQHGCSAGSSGTLRLRGGR